MANIKDPIKVKQRQERVDRINHYILKGYSNVELAEMFGMDSNSINYYRKKYIKDNTNA